jgi:hypothetical protein
MTGRSAAHREAGLPGDGQLPPPSREKHLKLTPPRKPSPTASANRISDGEDFLRRGEAVQAEKAGLPRDLSHGAAHFPSECPGRRKC